MEFTYTNSSDFTKAITALEALGLDYEVKKETIIMENFNMGPDKRTWTVTAKKPHGVLIITNTD